MATPDERRPTIRTQDRGFAEIVGARGPLAYHVEVYRIAKDRKARFESLYGDRLATFRLEALQSSPSEIERLYAFCGFAVDRSRIEETISGFDRSWSTMRRSRARR